ncbi:MULTISPECIES: alpha-ribazole phosphatase family protein [unclassified Pseudomonas]|uniref:alpha-ribazole phosphatase family protein n=1 Tax=unclassified Pseudomonas TaxID=196821 RepID=UPI0002A36342|nr:MULTISPECIES: alpha-ribazole phosphatase family protein [unclassified Pseudomonas]MBB1609623.1 alpha-ribazole phosphatase [Pseudomonas sp. UMC76]MBB1641778.1 alpha-ribazole phosphatase [Pseudomonas sp. UME83]NTX87812.1 alpha-ribazole phosphatase family protein [Pseudomonas sp. UMA643]NTY18316.1 alpha-ribazole phosphatase family protein [Pseudomonas sp. UMC3103]NTY23340.1 alpha-ribazole phosphatase family protein [Pseudomonas sp. UMA603]
MSLRLDLLRHGETELGGGFRGRLDDALTAAGWAQMQAGLGLEQPWEALVSSPLRRCAAFAERLSAASGLPLQLEPDLREMDFGEWEGLSTAKLMETDSDALARFWNDPYAFTPPGGEPLAAFEARVFAALQRLYATHAGKHLLLVTHGGVMRLLGARAQGLPREQLLQVSVAHGERLALRIEPQAGGWSIQPVESAVSAPR